MLGPFAFEKNWRALAPVWIGLILLKLKTYCWNHCSKIIFKCVNSTVRPIFNEKVAKKWNLWVPEQYMMHCLLQKSQHLRLLFIEQYMNSNHVSPKHVKKKKKEQKRKTQTGSKRKRVSKLAPSLSYAICCYILTSSTKNMHYRVSNCKFFYNLATVRSYFYNGTVADGII